MGEEGELLGPVCYPKCKYCRSEGLGGENPGSFHYFWHRCEYLGLAFIILCDEAIRSVSEFRVECLQVCISCII